MCANYALPFCISVNEQRCEGTVPLSPRQSHCMYNLNRSMELCRHLIISNEPLFERLSAAKFDLAVIDGVFFQKCLYLIPHRLGLPVVTYADDIDPLVVRVPWLPSFVPAYITTFTEHMTFFERLKNTAMTIALSFFSPIPDSPAEVLLLLILLCKYFPLMSH